MTRTIAALLLAGTAVLMTGCASTEPAKTAPPPNKENDVSTLPWNRPQSWEGKGMLGGMGGAGGQ